MRRFMKPFNHKTPSINLGAFQFLTTENSLLHRATALTFEGMTNGFKYALAHVRYTPNPLEKHKEDLKVLGDRFPYAKDGLDFYEIVYNFVKNYIEIYYSNRSISVTRFLQNFATLAKQIKTLAKF